MFEDNPFDNDALLKTIQIAKKRGYNPADVDAFAAAITQQNALRQRQMAQQPQVEQPKRRGGIGSFFLNLLPGGSLLDKKLHGEDITTKDVATEGALTLAPFGLGKLFKGLRGAKAAVSASRGADVLRGAQAAEAAPELGKISRSLLRQSTINPGNSTLKTASDQNRLIELARSLPGLRGGAARKFQNVEGEIGKMSGSVDDLYGSVKATVPADALTQRVDDVLSTITDKGERNAFTRIYNNTVRKAFGDKAPTELTPTQVNSLRRSINSQASGVFNKIEKGSTLSSTDNAILALREEFGTVLDDLAPDAIKSQVKPLNRNISTLMSGIPEFKRASEQAGKLPIVGQVPFISPLFGKATQGTADLAGRATSSRAMKILGPQAGVRMGADVLGLRDSPYTAEGEAPVSPLAQPTSPLDGPGATSGQLPPELMDPAMGAQNQIYTREAAAKDIQNDLQRTGGKNMDKYMSLYEFLNPEPKEGKAGLAGEKASSALNSISQLEQLYGQAGGGQQRAGGILQNLLGKAGGSSEVNAYNQFRDSLVAGIARGLGETGVLSDQDIKRYKKALPNIEDNPEEAAIKINALKELLQMNAQTPSAPDASSLLQQYGY